MVREQLTEDGLFILDAYGGSDSFPEMEEDRDLDGFTYVWDQNHYNPSMVMWSITSTSSFRMEPRS